MQVRAAAFVWVFFTTRCHCFLSLLLFSLMTQKTPPRSYTAATHASPLNARPGLQAFEPRGRPFFRYRTLRILEPKKQQALWLRFTLLTSTNGFRRLAEVAAIFYERDGERRMKKTALKQTTPLSPGALPLPRLTASSSASDLTIGECQLTQSHSAGVIQSKNHRFSWNLHFAPTQPESFNCIPEILSRFQAVRHSARTLCEELQATGTTQLDDQTLQWSKAPGSQSDFAGARASHSWVASHCNCFYDAPGGGQQQQRVPFIFDALRLKSRLGPLRLPAFSAFYFFYQGQHYFFNHLRDHFSLQSTTTLNSWEFKVDRKELSFRGTVQAEHRDFAGLTLEDTDGSLLYCASTALADLTLYIYRSGKLETTVYANGNAYFEQVDRNPNPYVSAVL